jgi:SAM-dependent methyltransferase/3',5'-cyclic AMP phosphodiesterase CpdA
VSDLANGLVVHQISDIHVGTQHFSPENKLHVPRPSRAFNLERYRDHIVRLKPEQRPDLLVVSGDLTCYGMEEEINEIGDALQNLLDALMEKPSDWRRRLDAAAPYLLLVPGNHDLDWTKQEHGARVDRFARMSDKLSRHGPILSAVTTANTSPYFDFGEECNLFVALFDSTKLGGDEHPQLASVARKLEAIVDHVDATTAKQLRTALDELRKEVRQDAGYISPGDLAKLETVVHKLPKHRIKLAVLHHNVSPVPTADIDRFDVVVNAGAVKAKLAELEFDILLHGHRHTVHCSHERLVHPGGNGQGMLIVGAGSLGSERSAPYLEITLIDSARGHSVEPPGSLVAVRSFEHNNLRYEQVGREIVQEVVSRPMHSDIGAIVKNLGRFTVATDAENLLASISRLLPPLAELQSKLVGWGSRSERWIEKFHDPLPHYGRIFATDVESRTSLEHPRFNRYVRDQYRQRLHRIRSQGEKAEQTLWFSHAVYEAIMRTGWEPDPTLWSGWRIAPSSDRALTQLEIARVLIRSRHAVTDGFSMESLDFDHGHYGIPLFVLDRAEIDPELCLDFAAAFDIQGNPHRTFEFDPKVALVTDRENDRGWHLKDIFEQLLANKRLMTVGQFLGRDSAFGWALRNPQFVASYDCSRRTSKDLLEHLKARLDLGPDKNGLDMGCGTGNYTNPFRPLLKHVVGIDVSAEMIRAARQKAPDGEWIEANALASDLPPESFDNVWAISTLHYFHGERQKLLFNEVARLLKPGGIAILDTEFWEQHESLWLAEFFPSLRNRYKNRCLPVATYQAWLQEAGLTPVDFPTFELSGDDADAGLRIGQRNPKKYLEGRVRNGLPAFREMAPAELTRGLEKLTEACRTGSINRTMAEYEQRASMNGDYGFIVARKPGGVASA